MLIARIYEVFPLVCTQYGTDMRIISFITDTASVTRILQHIGEPTEAPVLSTVRHCATQSCFACVPAQAFHGLGVRCAVAAHPPAWETFDQTPVLDPVAPAPEPGYPFDQTVTW